MRLFELFDYKAEFWDQTVDIPGSQFYETWVGNDQIELIYQSPDSDYWTVAFKRNGKTSQTYEGNANKIFSAVINHILEWVDKNQPRTLAFSADKGGSSSRVNLYSKMLDRYAQKLGYNIETEDIGVAVYFILVKKDPSA